MSGRNRARAARTGVVGLVGVFLALVEAVVLLELLVLGVPLVTSLVDAAGTNLGVSGHFVGFFR